MTGDSEQRTGTRRVLPRDADPRAVDAWRAWLRALASDAEAAFAAALAYESLDGPARDTWLDALEQDAPRIDVPRIAIYAPLLSVETDEDRIARIHTALGGDRAPVPQPVEARALRGVAADGARVVVLVLPLYLSFVQVFACRFQTHEGFAWARHDSFVRDDAAPRAGDDLEGAHLERTPMKPVVEELAHAVLAQRRRGVAAPPELRAIIDLFSPELDAEESLPGAERGIASRCGGGRGLTPRTPGATPRPRMAPKRPRLPGILGVVASAMGLFFSAFSTHDYAEHLDRQLHATHCSFVPGLTDATAGANACTVAMYSPYSAIFRDKYWGGVPIALFALGAYAFFLAFSVFLLTAGNGASKRSWQAFGIAACTPVVASAVMFYISATHLGAFCKLCVGLYVASLILATAGGIALAKAGGSKSSLPADATIPDAAPPFRDDVPPGYPQPAYAVPAQPAFAGRSLDGSFIPTGSFLVIPALLAALGVFALVPSFVYVSSLPDFKPYLSGCGTLAVAQEKHNALVKIPTTHPVKPAVMFEDPLCPTCKAFHDRLVSEGIYDNLDVTLVPFPLDSECNWMLDRALHPGACVLAKAVLCGDASGKARQILEWSYANQESLRDLGKAGKDALRAKVREQFPDVDACLDAKETKQRLDRVLHFAVDNKIPISTPQFFLDGKRICDEDTDLGLPYTIAQVAPEVMSK